MLDILCYFEIPHSLGGGGFNLLNPPGARGGGFLILKPPGAPGVGDLRFGAPHANTRQVVISVVENLHDRGRLREATNESSKT